MNVRKSIDCSQMYTAIGKIVCSHIEKGAAVMASEYVRANYPDVQGFSPRNLRRMRGFYRTYDNHPVLLSLATELGWTQNVVIMEADLTMELQEWYLRATQKFGLSKTELIARIKEQAHMEIVMDIEPEDVDFVENTKVQGVPILRKSLIHSRRRTISRAVLQRCRGRPKKGCLAWRAICFLRIEGKYIYFSQC